MSYAQAINATGDVVGWATIANGDTHPFLWTQRGGMVDISGGALPGGSYVQAYGINDSNQIVGIVNYGNDSAFFYNGTFSSLPGGSAAAIYKQLRPDCRPPG